MSREDFVAVGSRLFAVYLLLTSIRSAPEIFQVLWRADDMTSVYLYGLTIAIVLLVVAFLWFFPLTIARKLLPAMKEPRSEETMDSHVALSVGITLIGLWVLAYGIVGAVYWIKLFLGLRREIDTGDYVWPPEHKAAMVATAVQLVVAALFILGSSGIRKLIYRLRYGKADHAS